MDKNQIDQIAYPVILTESIDKTYVYIPGFDKSTEGRNIKDALDSATDLVKVLIAEYKKEGKPIPKDVDLNVENGAFVRWVTVK